MRLKELWKSQQVAYGIWSGLDDPIAVEIVGRSGFDFVVIDLQHGFASMSTSAQLMNALHSTESAAVVRVPWNTPDLVMRALDLGAEAVIVPLVNNADEASQAAAACRYAPAGNRSWGPLWSNPRRTMIEAAEGDRIATCIVMIETAQGIANLEQIVAVDGVHAVYVGPNDLSLSMGLNRVRYPESPELHDLIVRIITTAHDAGIAAGVDCNGAAEAHYWRDRGADFVISHTDHALLVDSLETAVSALRKPADEGS